MEMTLSYQGISIILSGKGSQTKASIPASQLYKPADIEYFVLLWQRLEMEKFCLFDTKITEFQQIEIDLLLLNFNPLFCESLSFPLVRPTDHIIPLSACTIAVNVKPYRYGHFQ